MGPGNRVTPVTVVKWTKLSARAQALVRGRLGDRHMREIVRGTGAGFSMRVAGAAFAFLFHALLARLLGAELAGIYYLAFTTVSVAIITGRVGLDNALLRFTATHAAAGDWEAVKGLYRQGIRITLLASGLSTVLVVLGAPLIAQTIFSEPELVAPLRWMALSIMPTSLLFVPGEMLKGLKRPGDGMFIEASGTSILGFLFLLVLGIWGGILAPVLAFVLASVVMMLVGMLLWRRAARDRLRAVDGNFDRRLLLATSFPLFLVMLMELVMRYSGTITLGIFADAADVGVYSVAMRTAMLTTFFLIAVNSIASPKLAALHHQGDTQALESVTRNSAKLTTALAAPMLLIFVLVPTWVLQLFGEDFERGALALAILAAGQFVNVATGLVMQLLMMTGHERAARNNWALGVVINIILNLLLIPPYGINGAAVATALSVVVVNLLAVVSVYRKLGVVSVGLRRR